MSKEFDAIIIGSGINALVAGAMLAKKNWSVLMCESSDHLEWRNLHEHRHI